jgi:hypothetical protein
VLLIKRIREHHQQYTRGRRGRDCMVVGFITIYAISAYHHLSRPWGGALDTTLNSHTFFFFSFFLKCCLNSQNMMLSQVKYLIF